MVRTRALHRRMNRCCLGLSRPRPSGHRCAMGSLMTRPSGHRCAMGSLMTRPSGHGCAMGSLMARPSHYLGLGIGSNGCLSCRGTQMGQRKPFRRLLTRKLPSDDCFEKDEKRCSKRIEHKDDDGDEDELVKNKGKAKKGGSNNAFSASCLGLLEGGVDEDNKDSENKIRVNEVAGSTPSEKRITELLNVGKDESTESGEEKVLHPQEGKEA